MMHDWRLTIHEGGHTVNHHFSLCDECGALVPRDDEMLHESWHERLNERLDDKEKS